jgi:hypothetical protein
MKNTTNKQTETLKKNMDSVSQNSKERIKSVIESNTKQFSSAIEANEKTFNSISKMLYEKEMDPAIVSSFKSAFGKSIKMSEDVIDSIIDAHTSRMDNCIDFTAKFMDVINSGDIKTKDGIDKLMELIKENLNKSAELSMYNMEKIGSVYNEHLNLALNFNKKFADNMNSQVLSMFKLQKKSIDRVFDMDMVSEWWKNAGEEKIKA